MVRFVVSRPKYIYTLFTCKPVPVWAFLLYGPGQNISTCKTVPAWTVYMKRPGLNSFTRTVPAYTVLHLQSRSEQFYTYSPCLNSFLRAVTA